MAKAKTTHILEGTNALLLAEGCKLSKIKKDAEKRIAEIKKKIGLKEEGIYKNEVGDILDISVMDKNSDIEPKKVMAYLKKMKMTARFPEVIKVQLTPLRKIVPESVIEGWQIKLDPIIKYSWK
jgi:hypothetical protein